MRIFIAICKAASGECHAYFFKNRADANGYAYGRWIGVREEERLDNYIGVYWVDLTSAFDILSKPDSQNSDKLNWGSDDSCFSPEKLVTNTMIAYDEYPGTFFTALEKIVDLIGGETGQDLRLKCEDARLTLNKVYLDVLNASGIPLGFRDKY